MRNSSIRKILVATPLIALTLAGCTTYSDTTAPVASTTATASSVELGLPARTGLTGWNFPVYDVPADPAVRYGILDNGMKYAILRNETPQDEVVLRMNFDIGWIDEKEGQFNAAHFIEHMAFNGSTNIPEGEMVKLLEREGLKFGADTNASTFFEDTTYKLSLPRNDAELIGTGLMLMREVGSELTFDPEAVNRERGILQSEIQTRNTFNRRLFMDYQKFIAPGTPFATNISHPTESAVTASITAEELRGIYERFYRPDNATLIVVGDVEPDSIETMVRERFSDWEKPAASLTETERGAIDFDRPAQAGYFVDPAVNYIVQIDRFAPYERKLSTVAQGRKALQLQLAAMVVNRRLQTLARDPEGSILGGRLATSDFFDRATQSNIQLVAKDGQWREALATAEQEIRRATLHGFTQSELDEALNNLETSLRNGAERQGTRPSQALADGILATVRDERIFALPETRLAVFESVRGDLTPEKVHEAFRETFTGSAPLIHIASKQDIEGGEEAILAAYNASSQVAVAAPEEKVTAAFAYDDFGTPGSVVADRMVEDLGYRELRFDNNVMLNLKKTDFKDKEILFHVRIGSGELAFGEAEPAASTMLNAISSTAALEAHDLDELQRIFAGRNVRTGMFVANDHFHVPGSTKAEDFLMQMQTAAAFLTAPGYRQEAEAQWKALIPPYIARLDANPQAVAGSAVPRIIANGDMRFGAKSEDVLLGTTLADLRAAVSPNLANSPIEITVVGDIDEQAIIDAVAQTFGALPERPMELNNFASARLVKFAQDRSKRTLYHSGAADQGMVQVYWPTTDDGDFREEVVGTLAAEALRLRLLETLREELGATYTPIAGLEMSDTFDDFGYLIAAAIVAPENQDLVFETISQIAGEMRATAVDDDLLARARNPQLEKLAKDKRENGYWLGSLEAAQLESDRLDRVRTYESILRSVTPADIRAFAQRYLDADQALEIAIVPKPAE